MQVKIKVIIPGVVIPDMTTNKLDLAPTFVTVPVLVTEKVKVRK
jgi:hypothetical protein